MAGINDQIFNREVSHAIFVHRLAGHEANTVAALLQEVLDDLEARLRGKFGTTLTFRSRTRLREIEKLVKEQVRLLPIRQALQSDLVEIAKMEAQHIASVLNPALNPLGLDIALPAAATLRTMVNTTPFEGEVLNNWFAGLQLKTQRDVARGIRQGVFQGETVRQIGKRVQRATAQSLRDAQTIARTATKAIQTRAKELTYWENRDIIKEVRYIATLDGRTSFICQGLDGNVYPILEGPRPPQHMNCRSDTTPVVKSWKELGIDLAEAPEGTRASFNGDVPAKTTYNEWLKGQPTSVQNEALGPTRARNFRAGRVQVRDFTDKQGNTLTLQELKVKEGLTDANVKVTR